MRYVIRLSYAVKTNPAKTKQKQHRQEREKEQQHLACFVYTHSRSHRTSFHHHHKIQDSQHRTSFHRHRHHHNCSSTPPAELHLLHNDHLQHVNTQDSRGKQTDQPEDPNLQYSCRYPTRIYTTFINFIFLSRFTSDLHDNAANNINKHTSSSPVAVVYCGPFLCCPCLLVIIISRCGNVCLLWSIPFVSCDTHAQQHDDTERIRPAIRERQRAVRRGVSRARRLRGPGT